jgi:hypothetical protein
MLKRMDQETFAQAPGPLNAIPVPADAEAEYWEAPLAEAAVLYVVAAVGTHTVVEVGPGYSMTRVPPYIAKA